MWLAAALAVGALLLGVASCGEEETEPATVASSAPAPSEETGPTADDIVDTAFGTEELTTLATALAEADLLETLEGETSFTVFAPTDAAFDKLPEGTIDTLLEDPQGQLTEILTYHVVPGKVMSTDLSDGMMAATVQGGELTISIGEDGTVMVNDATVTTADIEASNGVIHVIDTVLIPPEE